MDGGTAAVSFSVGDVVEADIGAWYPGKVSAVNPDGTYAILFDDGDSEPSIKAGDIRRKPID